MVGSTLVNAMLLHVYVVCRGFLHFVELLEPGGIVLLSSSSGCACRNLRGVSFLGAFWDPVSIAITIEAIRIWVAEKRLTIPRLVSFALSFCFAFCFPLSLSFDLQVSGASHPGQRRHVKAFSAIVAIVASVWPTFAIREKSSVYVFYLVDV